MTTTLKKWRVYCETELTYHDVWLDADDPKPTTCPVNTAHTVNDILTIDVSEHNITTRVIIEEEYSTKTQGYFRSKGVKMVIDGNVGAVTSEIMTWDYPITLLTGWFHAKNNHVGDWVSCKIAPDMIIGSIEAPVYVGNTDITVSYTVTQNSAIGFDLTLTDGVNSNYMGEVIAINGNVFTMKNPAVNSFSPLSPTYIKQTVTVVDRISIEVPLSKYSFAEKKQGGKGIPPNVPVVIYYHNESGGNKFFSFNVEYMY